MSRFRRPAGAAGADAASGGMFRSLHVRNFRLFFTGQLVSQAGNWMALVAQTLLVYHLTHDGVAVGIAAACQYAPMLVIGAWAGLLADRSNKRRMLVVIQVLWMLQSFTYAALAFMDKPPLAPIFALALAGGVAAAFENPARRSFVVEMVPADHLSNAVSLNSSIMTGGRVFGPALAGLLIAVAGYGWCFTLNGLSFIAVIVAYLAMRQAELYPAPIEPRAKGQVREGIRYVRRTPELLIALGMVAIIGALSWNFNVVFPLVVKRTFHESDVAFTILFSILSIGSVIGSLLIARRGHVDLPVAIGAAVAFGLSMALFAGAPTLAIAYPLAMLVGLTSTMFMTSSSTIVQLGAAPQMRGRVVALHSIVVLGTAPLGNPFLGWICDVLGPRAGVLVGAVAALGAAGWGARRLAAMHRQADGGERDDQRPLAPDIVVRGAQDDQPPPGSPTHPPGRMDR